MTRRTPPEGLSEKEHRQWLNSWKNRNLHSVKFDEELEADFQAWRAWWRMTPSAAIKHLVSTHPDLKKKPND